MIDIHSNASGFSRSIVIIGLCGVLAIAASSLALAEGTDSVTALTDKSYYRVSISPASGPAPVGKLHDWIIHVETEDGRYFTPTQLVITGGMPGHGHGFPSRPQVTRYLQNGDYLVEGMLFNMGGVWQILVGVTGPDGPDRVALEVSILAPPVEVPKAATEWSTGEIGILKSLWIGSLPPQRADSTNRLSQDAKAARLGKKLFFDAKLSAPGTVSCASCHVPEMRFTDGKRVSFGTGATTRNAPTLLGAGYHSWFYWDGRRDSLWAQALTPIESVGEMDNNRTDAVRYVLQHAQYRREFLDLGGYSVDVQDQARYKPGAGPYAAEAGRNSWSSMRPEDRNAVNRAFADIGKLIAAYVEQLNYRASRFDEFAEALIEHGSERANPILSNDERKGLKLFLDAGRTQCLRCHNGPLFTNFGFHNIATGGFDGVTLDLGRMIGLQAALVDEFNCGGAYSDADQCSKLKFAADNHGGQGAFKVPGLRDVELTHPYMHDGRFADLFEVVRYYTEVPPPEAEPHEVPPLSLSEDEIGQMVAFLKTLTGT